MDEQFKFFDQVQPVKSTFRDDVIEYDYQPDMLTMILNERPEISNELFDLNEFKSIVAPIRLAEYPDLIRRYPEDTIMKFLQTKVPKDGNKAILNCTRMGYVNCVEFLLNNKTTYNEKGIYNKSLITNYNDALQIASQNGHLEIVRLLLPYSNNYNEALRLASQNGHTEIVELLLPRSDNYNEALQSASYYGHLEIVKLLLPISDPMVDNSFALRMASEKGHTKIVELLLPRSDNYNAALIWASKFGHLEIFKLLLPLSDNYSEALIWASLYGHLEVVKLLIPVSEPRANNSEALHWASQNGYKEIVELLLPISDNYDRIFKLIKDKEIRKLFVPYISSYLKRHI